MVKIAKICRFHHNWMFLGKDKKTAAMRHGLAKGQIYAHDPGSEPIKSLAGGATH